MALFCAAIIIDAVSLFNFFSDHVPLISCAMSLVSCLKYPYNYFFSFLFSEFLKIFVILIFLLLVALTSLSLPL